MDQLPVLFTELACRNGTKIGVATLNAEKSLNALNLPMIESLLSQLKKWQHNNTIVCVWLQSTDGKAFCAGADVISLYASSVAYGETLNNDNCMQFFSCEYALDYCIHRYTKPVIVWGHGIVMGGGLGLMAGANHRVATESTRIAMPEVKIGLYPDAGASWFLQRAAGKIGLFLGLTGANINGPDGQFAGLVDYLLADEYKGKILNDLATADWNNSDTGTIISTILHRHEPQSKGAMPAANLASHYERINALCTGSDVNEICQRLLSYQTDDVWLSGAINTLRHGCPVTPHLVIAQMQRGSDLSLADIFRMELVMSRHCATKGHFKEGVRALLIDKDHQPKWAHNSISAVSQAEVDAFFQPFADDPLAHL